VPSCSSSLSSSSMERVTFPVVAVAGGVASSAPNLHVANNNFNGKEEEEDEEEVRQFPFLAALELNLFHRTVKNYQEHGKCTYVSSISG
jgi:hypothetical protein